MLLSHLLLAAMNSLPGATPSLHAKESESGDSSSRIDPDGGDQHFLLYFIMGTYFGPDIKDQKNHKSALQRKAENLPPYTSDQLVGSHIKRVELERIYYYVLRKADQSLRVKLPLLRQYVQGNFVDFSANYPQFTDLFPLKLHPHSRIRNQFKVIENLVFINNPETSYIKAEDIGRFKSLTGLQDFLLSRNAATLHAPMSSSDTNNNFLRNEVKSNREPRQTKSLEPLDQNVGVTVSLRGLPAKSEPMKHIKGNVDPEEKVGQVTGTPAKGLVGPLVGLMDIGESEDSYLFRVSLPGVKRDEREFGCEVEDSGKVLIRGVTTTGEKRVHRYSQVFEMQTQNLCPPGHFSVSFQLPGPVDPQQFCGNFGTDGILEGIVMKRQMRS